MIVLALAAGGSHPAVAALLGLGAAAVSGGVVAMAWNVHTRQVELAEQRARRIPAAAQEQAGAVPAARAEAAAQVVSAGAAANGHGGPPAAPAAPPGAPGARKAGAGGRPGAGAPSVVIDGPDTVVTGEQVRYRVRPSGTQTVVSWAAGGGAVTQAPDPAHPDELLLVADRPASLIVSARVREGLTESRVTKSVTAVQDVSAAAAPSFTVRLFEHGWGLAAVAVLIVGFAGALAALGSLSSADFIALVAPLAAVLGVVAVARGAADGPGGFGGSGGRGS